MSYGDESDVFGIDVSGWVEQHRSRDVYEVVREPIQNAMDTGADLAVRVDYGDQSVTVEDYGAGVEELSQFYDLFSGEKRYDPEKRGRFGRGVKEFIGASDETVIASTGGGLRFRFDADYDEDRDEYVVDASRTRYPDAQREEGTVVYGTNDAWSEEDLYEVEEFVDRLWLPEDQDLALEVYDDDGDLQRETVVSYPEPDAVLEDVSLPTLVVEDGVQEEETRRTDVEVKRTDPGDGAIYELGIPVTTEETFPFQFNVGQKTPVTERRNELDNSYRTDLMRGLINERLDLFEDDELGEEYVTQYLSEYTYKTSQSVQEAYIERRFGTEPDDLLVYTDSTPSIAVTWAMQRQLPMENADEYSRSVRGMLQKRCPSVQDWYDEQTDNQSIEVVEDPAPEQAAFLDYVESELVDRTHVTGVDFELAYISEDTEDGQTKATYSPADDTVYLNAFADEWTTPTPKRIGTVLHELGHHESNPSEDGHGPDWYHEVEELGGELIHQLLAEQDNLHPSTD